MNRRDLLKWFGAGAVVAPVVDGLGIVTAQAKLLEPPKVELFTPDTELGPLPLGGGVDIIVQMRERKTGKVWTYSAETFVAETKAELIDVTDTYMGGNFRRFLPSPSVVEWMMRGRIIGPVKWSEQ